MINIGLLSDTHSFLEPKLEKFFSKCEQVWHCGDIGDVATSDKLESTYPVFKGVYGNIDNDVLRRIHPQDRIFYCEDVKVLMTHIGGYPGNYDRRVMSIIDRERPNLFLCGHSHIAKIMYDKTFNMLHINPGAIGNHGFHKVKTAIRFIIDKDRVKDLEIIEIERI